ncbi:MAG: TraR/DksA C4-type zinc finger protein [Patescibacteria group bacterium]
MTDRNAYEAKLEEILASLTSELEAIATREPSTGDWVAVPVSDELGNADSNVEADAVEDWNERRATVAELEMRYRSVARTLEKISNGTFGICEICQEKIEIDRLNANPAARTCKVHMERERELPL